MNPNISKIFSYKGSSQIIPHEAGRGCTLNYGEGAATFASYGNLPLNLALNRQDPNTLPFFVAHL